MPMGPEPCKEKHEGRGGFQQKNDESKKKNQKRERKFPEGTVDSFRATAFRRKKVQKKEKRAKWGKT